MIEYCNKFIRLFFLNGTALLLILCGKYVNSEGRLPQPNQFPWIASIEVFKDTSHPAMQCTGNLIALNWILTSADCLDLMDNEGYIILIKLGSNYRQKIEEGEQIQKTTEFYVFPYYDRKTEENNIALIKLQNKPVINDHVQIISTSTFFDEEKYAATLVGWASSTSATFSKDRLTYNIIAAISNEECQKYYKKFNIAIERNVICSKDYNTYDPYKLSFETGGSLIKYSDQTKVLVGISGRNAYNSSRNPSEVPIRYARVSEYVEWIGYQISLWDLKNEAKSFTCITYLISTLFVVGILL